jgi:hypothetical protein
MLGPLLKTHHPDSEKLEAAFTKEVSNEQLVAALDGTIPASRCRRLSIVATY